MRGGEQPDMRQTLVDIDDIGRTQASRQLVGVEAVDVPGAAGDPLVAILAAAGRLAAVERKQSSGDGQPRLCRC